MSFAMMLLFPTPGGPVKPTLKAAPVSGKMPATISCVSGSPRSILEITRASARRSPESNRSTSPLSSTTRLSAREPKFPSEKPEYDTLWPPTSQVDAKHPHQLHASNMYHSVQHVEDDPDPQRPGRVASDAKSAGGEGRHDALGLPSLRDRADSPEANPARANAQTGARRAGRAERAAGGDEPPAQGCRRSTRIGLETLDSPRCARGRLYLPERRPGGWAHPRSGEADLRGVVSSSTTRGGACCLRLGFARTLLLSTRLGG